MAKLLVKLGSRGVALMSSKIFDEKGNIILSEEGLTYLEEKYSSEEAPDCPVCGEQLEISSISSRGTTYACTNATYPTNYNDVGYGEIYKAYTDHYARSCYNSQKHGDPFVISLIEAYRNLLSNPVSDNDTVVPNNDTKILDFLRENQESTADQISQGTKIPLHTVRNLIFKMHDLGIVSDDSVTRKAYDTSGNAIGHYRYPPSSPVKWSLS